MKPNENIKKKQIENRKHQKHVSKVREAAQKKADKTLHKLVSDIDNHPHNYRTYYDLGTFLVELKSYTQAEELLMKALGLFADKSKRAKNALLYGLGNVYYSAGDFDKAIKQFQQVDDEHLKVDAYIMLAQSYMSKKDYKRAIVFALTAQGHRRQDPDVNRLLGESLLALGNFKESAQFYDHVLNALPNDGRANFDRGIVAMVLGEDFHEYFARAQKYDEKYFKKGQKKLADIERFIQVQRKNKNNQTKK
ncbi:hypothetical protein WR164_09850 [Philodulcilactobacillus myokoensis]|uniref:Tetratricopeptide repeat protein n=1 Tax=Philodulcilactobacillus myokoensis TaxID=2929573 RepID=A0A9W6B1D4_9LACO|nr:tetratricopeptide repeat protein [Philodulcilactobacillus myokoensis]GLB47006.1 hypothetical protein WR164_09850 [Philodulcilactobacillus myokoensis]